MSETQRPAGGSSAGLGPCGSLGAFSGVYTTKTPGAFSARAVSMCATFPRAIVLVIITACATFATGISAE